MAGSRRRLCAGIAEGVHGSSEGARGGRPRLVASGVGFGRGRRLRVGEAHCEADFAGGRHGGRGVGFADNRRRSEALQTKEATVEFVASRRSGQRAAPVGRGGYEGSAGRGRASGRGGAEASVSFAQPCSEIRGQRKNGRLGGDDFRLASYVFDGMPARKERGKRKRERWGAGPLAGGVQGAWAH
uniref:Uncharacterized protein n=1 Tax=Oryza rufipogon TaxID=4529 RepID=A0A0E0P6Z5_ORYRU